MSETAPPQPPAGLHRIGPDEHRPVVLICSDYFRPGFKGGGPVTSIVNMIGQLASEVDFRIVARDRDLGDSAPYTGIDRDVFHPFGGARVMYLNERDATIARFVALLRELAPDTLYLNSVLSRRFSLRPLLAARFARSMGQIPPSIRVVIAPRGEFAPGALSIKSRRKSLYLQLLKTARLWKGVRWQASSGFEAEDIRRHLRGHTDVVVAPDLAAPLSEPVARPPKAAGHADFVFLGRISPIKNLEHSIRALSGLRGSASFTVYGPIEDAAYWDRCRAAASALPDNVIFAHGGTVTPDAVAPLLARADALLLASLSENFAQVVIEALGCACPVVLSDQTPWRDLQAKGVGWDLPLDDLAQTRAALQQLIDMNEDTHRQYRSRARTFAGEIAENRQRLECSLQLFRR